MYAFSDATCFSHNRRGTKTLFVHGFKYYKHLEKGDKIRWTCALKSTMRCKAIVLTIQDEIIYLKNEHNHPRENCRINNSAHIWE